MVIDPITFAIVSAFVAAITGALLGLLWWQNREANAALWWGLGDLALGAGVLGVAIAEARDSYAWLVTGVALFSLAPGLAWTATRAFERLPPRPLLLAAGVIAIVVIASIFPLGSLPGALLSAWIISGFYACAAFTLFLGRGERLPARFPLIGLLAVHASVLAVVIPLGPVDGAPIIPPVLSLPGLVHFDTIVFLIGSALLLVGLTQERSLMRHQSDAQTDPLTGLANRRAFTSIGERLMERCRHERTPLAVVTFDLDHFKAVNDTFGHALGDQALQLFAEVATGSLRPNDLLSRIGGEEFTALLPATSLQAAVAFGERVRRAFAEAGATIDGQVVNVTVSVGVTVSDMADAPLALMLEQADAALYRAKICGRNRVEGPGPLDGQAKRYPRLVDVA